jgi:hypothetical protein
MGNATDKQKFYLKSKNVDASNMDYDTASKLIGQFKNQANSIQAQQPVQQQYDKPKFDSSSYYVAYAKDIVVALIGKMEYKEGMNIDTMTAFLMQTAIKSVLDAREAFNA